MNNKFEETRKVGILPYQQGRGIFDFMSRDVIYNPFNGLVDIANTSTLVPAEGAIPGRNVCSWNCYFTKLDTGFLEFDEHGSSNITCRVLLEERDSNEINVIRLYLIFEKIVCGSLHDCFLNVKTFSKIFCWIFQGIYLYFEYVTA